MGFGCRVRGRSGHIRALMISVGLRCIFYYNCHKGPLIWALEYHTLILFALKEPL